ncbi:TPA: hypothetical protein N0F65_001773 [Lagenidium giganteum]|uniref:Uncharacterized protein n=1 Tax=Lagenidium giganteum TaxID=4803 RepID=A0AAV2Z939_9STRA|nr:TPA: hypothetical protein N0F65_001773 [Lagenidium giganteum]
MSWLGIDSQMPGSTAKAPRVTSKLWKHRFQLFKRISSVFIRRMCSILMRVGLTTVPSPRDLMSSAMAGESRRRERAGDTS